MATKLYVVSTFTIQPGKFDEFMALGNEAIKIVHEQDTQTTHYEWFFNEDKTQCTVLEGYESGAAALAHLGRVNAILGQALQIATFSAKLLGDASPELLQAAAGLNIEVQSDYAISFAQ